MAYIEFQHVKKFYGKKNEAVIKALDDTNFAVEEGELAVILGASGAGKTTALNILGGMDQATEGEVVVAGEHLNKFSEKELVKYRRNDVGFVFQFYNLVPNLTALENVELAVQICKDYLNPDSLKVQDAYAEPALLEDNSGIAVQFERLGYFFKDPDSTPERAVFNKTTSLKDSFKVFND